MTSFSKLISITVNHSSANSTLGEPEAKRGQESTRNYLLYQDAVVVTLSATKLLMVFTVQALLSLRTESLIILMPVKLIILMPTANKQQHRGNLRKTEAPPNKHLIRPVYEGRRVGLRGSGKTNLPREINIYKGKGTLHISVLERVAE